MTAALAVATTEREWALRPFDAERDTGALMYMLGVGYTRSRAGWRAGASGSGWRSENATPDHEATAKQRAFMTAHAPLWTWLLENADVTLAVDAEDPDTIWGWIVTSEPNVVHAIGCKRSLIKAGVGREVVLDLAGDRWRSHQVVTLELPQLRSARGSYKSTHILDLDRPHEWSLDPTWLLTRMVSR